MFACQITRIEFDLTTDEDIAPHILEELDNELQNQFIGRIYQFDSEDDADEEIADFVSDECGWCVNTIHYEKV